MFKKTKLLFSNMFWKNPTISQKPLTGISILFVIFFDIFLFYNIFQWYSYQRDFIVAPYEQYSCKNFFDTKDTQDLVNNINIHFKNQARHIEISQDLSKACKNIHQQLLELTLDQEYQNFIDTLTEINDQIEKKEQEVYTYENQYSQYLYESSAGIYSSNDRLSEIEAGNAKVNYQKILNEKNALLEQKELLLNEIQQNTKFQSLSEFIQINRQNFEAQYQKSIFWYPVKVALFQAFLLIPLFFGSLLCYSYFYKKQNKIFTILFSNLTFITGIFVFILFLKFVYFLLPKKFLVGFIAFLKSLSLGFLWNYILIILWVLLFWGIIYASQKAAEKYEILKKEQERLRIEQNKKKIMKERFQKSACIECWDKLLPDSDFCQTCGMKQHDECSECHAKIPKIFDFCNKCGNKKKQ